MAKTHSIVLFLVFALAVQEIKSSTFMGLSGAAKNGVVDIKKDEHGSYVEVDFTKDAEKVSKLLLDLTSSYTFLAGDKCLSFEAYNCETFDCKEVQPTPVDVDYPYFKATGKLIKAESYLDYQNWVLKASPVHSETCTSEREPTYGTSRAGVIGLGADQHSKENFIGSKVFSFNFDKNLVEGKFLFKFDSSLTASDTHISLNADQNWISAFANGDFTVADVTDKLSGWLIFDIHADALGFPAAVFKRIITELSAFKKMACNDGVYQPSCAYIGPLSELPTFKLKMGETELLFPPEVYVKDPKEKYDKDLTLNLKSLSPTGKGPNFVTEWYKDSIILNPQFMSHYYTVFDRSGEKAVIKLYEFGTSSGGSWTTTIIVIIVVLVVVAAGGFYLYKKKKDSSSSDYERN